MDILAPIITANRAAAEALLAAIVRVPSDNPAGDCAPHAAATAPLLEALGFTVERHPVPPAAVAAVGMQSCTNLIIRRRFGHQVAISQRDVDRFVSKAPAAVIGWEPEV